MTHSIIRKNRNTFRPSVGDSALEDRVVMTASAAGRVHAFAVSLTPAPALPPFTPGTSAASVHRAIVQQTRQLATDVRRAINNQVTQLFANGKPTAQQRADFNAAVQGISNAAALKLSGQASLLPGSSTLLGPSIQNDLLGAGSSSLISRIQAFSASGRTGASASALQAAVTRQLNTTLQAADAQFNNFFNTTSLNRLSVGQNGQRIPLQQFMGNQLLNQVSNTLGLLAHNIPTVANSTLFPNGTTDANGLPVTPSQSAINAFNQMAGNALQTAAFQLASGLSIFPGASSGGARIQPFLFGTGSGANSLAAELQNAQFGSTGLNSSLMQAFNGSFQNISGALSPILGVQNQANATLPTTGFTNPLGSSFGGSSFANGFNNGFATGQSNGFFGFGQAPSGFNSNFGTGFNNFVSGQNNAFGFGNSARPGFGSGANISGGGNFGRGGDFFI